MNEPTDLDLCRVLEALSLVVGADQFMPAVPGMSPEDAGAAADILDLRGWITVDSPRRADGKLAVILRPRLTNTGLHALERCRSQRIGVNMTQSAAATGLDQSVEGKDIRRAQFMDQLYDAVAGVVVELTPASAIGQALGWPGDETDRIILYLQGKGFIKIVTTDGLIQILQRGVDAVEDARRRPDTRTEHLPAYRDYHNTITITINAPVSNSPILAGSPGAVQTQSATITSQESTDIVQLLDLYREALDASPFTNQTDVETAAQVLDKIRAELNQPNPDRTSIQEGLNALGQLAIGVGASAAWSGVLAVLPHIHL